MSDNTIRLAKCKFITAINNTMLMYFFTVTTVNQRFTQQVSKTLFKKIAVDINIDIWIWYKINNWYKFDNKYLMKEYQHKFDSLTKIILKREPKQLQIITQCPLLWHVFISMNDF